MESEVTVPREVIQDLALEPILEVPLPEAESVKAEPIILDEQQS